MGLDGPGFEGRRASQWLMEASSEALSLAQLSLAQLRGTLQEELPPTVVLEAREMKVTVAP